MREHRFRIMITATTLWSLVLAGTAQAIPHTQGQGYAEQLEEGGQVSADMTIADEQTHDGPLGPGPETPGRSTTGSLITYHWVSTGEGCWYGEVWDEASQSMVVSSGKKDAIIYERVRVDRSTNPPTETAVAVECFQDHEAPAPPPPPPPTLEEVSALARELIIVPDVRVSPYPELGGVTGLETWFWYDGQDEVTATAEIRGYNVTATMRPSRYYWDPDHPRGVILESHRPGSKENPAARWVYETKGDYRIRVQIVWDGTWSFTGLGVTESGDLSTVRATGTADYRVDEVRSELTSTR